MLQAYQRVLPRHGIAAAEDTHYYRLIITLSLRPEANWWAKMQAELSLWQGATILPLAQPDGSVFTKAAATSGPADIDRPPADAILSNRPR